MQRQPKTRLTARFSILKSLTCYERHPFSRSNLMAILGTSREIPSISIICLAKRPTGWASLISTSLFLLCPNWKLQCSNPLLSWSLSIPLKMDSLVRLWSELWSFKQEEGLSSSKRESHFWQSKIWFLFLCFYRAKSLIEDDLFLGNSDKLIFLMKEFKAHMSPSLIKHRANPLLVAKLDIKVRKWV